MTKLKRSLGLVSLTFYGIGLIIGAGLYSVTMIALFSPPALDLFLIPDGVDLFIAPKNHRGWLPRHIIK
jgi:hypothetical protein